MERGTRVVIDTHLLASGLLSPQGATAKLINRLANRDFHLYLSRSIFLEYQTVINQFNRIAKGRRDKLLGKIRHHAFWVDPKERVNIVRRDLKDNMFIECAITSEADFLITGDHDLLSVYGETVLRQGSTFRLVVQHNRDGSSQQAQKNNP